MNALMVNLHVEEDSEAIVYENGESMLFRMSAMGGNFRIISNTTYLGTILISN